MSALIPLDDIPIASVDLSGNEEAYVVDAIRLSVESSTGKYVDEFERAFATLCDFYRCWSV